MKGRGNSNPGSRISRINDEIKKVVSEVIRSEIKDPRVSSLTSVTKVETTSDLKYCKIYISVLGNEEEKKEALAGLKNASGFVRKKIANTINLRNTPEITFIIDDSLDYSIRMSELIKKANEDSSSANE